MELGDQTVTLVWPPGRDWRGDPLPGPGTEIPVEGCMVQPNGSSETTAGKDTVTSGLALWLPAGTPIDPTVRVRYGGAEYAVDGKPGRWVDDAGDENHVQVQLRLVEGG